MEHACSAMEMSARVHQVLVYTKLLWIALDMRASMKSCAPQVLRRTRT